MVKLSKNGSITVLHLTVVMRSASNLARTVCQEIPVDVQSADYIPLTLPPADLTPDVTLVCGCVGVCVFVCF